jgi:hypothetical protein
MGETDPTLAIGERAVRLVSCDQCGREYEHITGFIYGDGDAHSIYYAACHGHPEHEVWLDVILGTWGEDDYVEDHRTFSCRIGEEGATAVDASAVAEGKADLFGRKLTREEALADPLVGTFWNVVDLVALEDPSVAAHLAGNVSPGDTDDVSSPRAKRRTEE